MKPLLKLYLMLGIVSLEFQNNKAALSKDQVDKLKETFKKDLKRNVEFTDLEFDNEGFASFDYETLANLNEAIPDTWKPSTGEPQKTPTQNNDDSGTEGGNNSSGTDPPHLLHQEKAYENLLSQINQQRKEFSEKLEAIATAMENAQVNDPLVVSTSKNAIQMKKQFSKRERVIIAGKLFGEGAGYLSVDNTRPWNKAAETMLIGGDPKPFLGTSVDFTQINSDFGEFIAGRKGEIIRWFNPNDDFNRVFPLIDGVQEGDLFMSLELTDITQAYQKNWTPQGKATFTARKPKLFDIKIDLEFENLKAIERSWLSEFNNEGSYAYKMSFIEFLLFSIASKAVLEDQIAMINGKFVAPTNNVAGNYINKMDGLREMIFKLVEEKLAKPFVGIGEWNSGNIIAFTRAMIESVPEEMRSRPNLGFYASNEYIETYWTARRLAETQVLDYDPNKSVIPGYPNIRLLSVPFMGGSKRVFITPIGNVRQLFGYKDAEYPKFKIEESKRVVNVLTDYKKSLHISVAGAESATSQEFIDRSYDKQLIWFNNVDLPSTNPMNANKNQTVLDVTRHKYIRTVANSSATAITNITGAVLGDEIKIECGSLDNASTIANSGNFVLTAAFNPDAVGEYILLYKRSDGKFVETARFDPVEEPAAVAFDDNDVTPSVAGVAPKNGVAYFKTANGHSAARTITNLDDAVETVDYKIYGNDGTHATTIPNSGNFVLTAAWTGAAAAWIVLRKRGSKFYEISRNA